MNSKHVSLKWRCGCGRENQSQIWRLVDGRTDPQLLDVRSPGLLWVTYSCEAQNVVDEPVVLIRSTELAPVIVFLSCEHLDDVDVLADLQNDFGAIVPGPPMTVPRELLPVVLTRDTDQDTGPSSEPSGYAEHLGSRLGAMYTDFLHHALTHYERVRSEQLLWNMLDVSPDGLSDWLQEHPEALRPGVLNSVQQLAERATSFGDEIARGPLLAARDLLIALANSTPLEDAVEDFQRALIAHNEQVIAPKVEDLWDAAGFPNRGVAIGALRELAELSLGLGDVEFRRQTVAELAARLLGHGRTSDETDEAISLLEEVREVSALRDDVWATATGNLAAALGERRTGDIADDRRRTVALLREALTAVDVDVRTMAARARLTLGSPYLKRHNTATPRTLTKPSCGSHVVSLAAPHNWASRIGPTRNSILVWRCDVGAAQATFNKRPSTFGSLLTSSRIVRISNSWQQVRPTLLSPSRTLGPGHWTSHCRSQRGQNTEPSR